MASRLELQQEFTNILGNENVYFRPPETIKLNYPCIIYKKTPGRVRYADNKIYMYKTHYDVLVIYKNPDDDWDERLLNHFQYIRHERHYFTDGLNHDAFSLYY